MMQHFHKAFWLSGAVLLAGLFLIRMGYQAAPKVEGAAVFKKQCVMCHGEDGKGFAAMGTPDFTEAKWQESVKDSAIIETIKNGKKENGKVPMPPFGEKLSKEEIQALLAHVRSFKKS